MCCALQMTQPSEVGEDIDYLSLQKRLRGERIRGGKGIEMVNYCVIGLLLPHLGRGSGHARHSDRNEQKGCGLFCSVQQVGLPALQKVMLR